MSSNHMVEHTLLATLGLAILRKVIVVGAALCCSIALVSQRFELPQAVPAEHCTVPFVQFASGYQRTHLPQRTTVDGIKKIKNLRINKWRKKREWVNTVP